MRASFTAENVEAMKSFDPELARKAQIAMDNKLPINFVQLEMVEENLPRLLAEKSQLETARAEVAKLPVGTYTMPKVDISAASPVPGQKTLTGTMMEQATQLYPEEVAKYQTDAGMKQIGLADSKKLSE